MLLELGQGVIAHSHVNNLNLKLINGATISLKGSDRPETMRGVSLSYVVLDEFADFKPEVWELILRPALADLKGSALFIGTPMGRNHFYDLYSEALAGKLEDYNAWHFTSYDNPLIDPTEIDSAKGHYQATPLDKSLWLHLRLEALRCLRKIGLSLMKKSLL